MNSRAQLQVMLRRQRLGQDEGGYIVWQDVSAPSQLILQQTALVLCDVWNEHGYANQPGH